MPFAPRSSSRRRRPNLDRPHGAARRWLSALSALTVGAGLLFGAGAAPAAAAGPAQLNLEIHAVHDTAGYGQYDARVEYDVTYSCSTDVCTDTTITLPATQLDPTYEQFRLLTYSDWTPPADVDAEISADAASAVTVSLGDLQPGASATFRIVYVFATNGGYSTAIPAAFMPPGFQIEQSATIGSPNATSDVTAEAEPVTWESEVPEPSISKSGPGTVRPDEDVTYTLRMGSGCFVNGGSGRIIGNGSNVCAESYTVVDELPEQAVFQSASDGGVYHPETHTVTWAASGVDAAGGWGSSSSSGWVSKGPYHPRTVTVTYPASAFPEGADGSDFTVPVTNEADVEVTYLDEERTTKTASASKTHDVARITPFTRIEQAKGSTSDARSGNTRYVDVPPDVTGMVCAETGFDDWARTCEPGEPLAAFDSDNSNYWNVDTRNKSNVPAVATVVDENLADSAAQVYRIEATDTTPRATIEYTITDGETTTEGTASDGYTAPAGFWITDATVTSGLIPAGSVRPEDDVAGWNFQVRYTYRLLPGAELGQWDNTASATMTFPENPEFDDVVVQSQGSVVLRDRPKTTVTPSFAANIDSAEVLGEGQAVPGTRVAFTLAGNAAGIPENRLVSPQYIFFAPIGWEIERGSAAFSEDAPAGAAYSYRDVTIGEDVRQAVVASWPTGTTIPTDVAWPKLTVVASPTYAVKAETLSRAHLWIGDSLGQYGPDDAKWATRAIDAPDADADGDTAEAFASASRDVRVSGTSRLDLIKEICVETADGCDWVSDPDITVGVAPEAEDISYRVTLRNGGNGDLTDVVGYDILPFVGDGRTSTFGQTLARIDQSDDDLALSFSDSTNPCRPEVADAAGCDPDWDATADGASAIRVAVDGVLEPGAEATFTFSSHVVPGADTDAVACNSMQIDSAETLPSSPRAVCATTQEADLAVSVPERLPLQAGRPGVVPFTVTNLGGSENAPARVDIDVPEGIRITSLAPAGWSCDASDTDPDGSVLGPVTLTCDAVTAEGASRPLAKDAPEELALPAVIPDDALVDEQTCFAATVSGFMFDPDLGNNETEACFTVVDGSALIGLTKDDGLTEAAIGQEVTYSLDVSNLLVGESLEEITVTDELPDNVVFVSASDTGSIAGQAEPDANGDRLGGVVTWTLDALAPAGVPGPDGAAEESAAGAQRAVTVTVRIPQSAETTEEIVNGADVSVADPANRSALLTDSDDDTDALLRESAVTLVKSVSPATVAAVGDTVSYEFLVTNEGTVTLTDVGIDEGDFSGTGDAIEVSCPAEAASLAPQESVTCTASYDVTQEDLDAGVVSNTATATATAPAGVEDPASAPSSAFVTADAAAALSLVKTATPTEANAAGDEIAYSFQVTNAGNVTVTDVAIAEGDFTGDPAGLSDVVCPDGPLAPGDSVECSATYTLTQDDVDAGALSNTATATADAPGAVPDPESDESTAPVTIAANPALTLAKSVSDTTDVQAAGDPVTYLFEVENTGNVTLSGVSILETGFGGAGDPVAVECPEGDLAPGAATTCVGTYQVVQDDLDAGGFDNTAVATATAPDGADVGSDESTANLDIERLPGLGLVKSASPTELVVGEEITYSFVVTNTGNVTATDVAIEEQAFSGAADLSDVVCDTAAASLAPGAQTVCQATYEIQQDDVDAGEIRNTALASAASSAGALESEESSVQVPFEQQPAMSLLKTADTDGYAAAGEEIGYSFRVENTGNVSLSAISIVEGEFTGTGELSDVECPEAVLLPGQFTDCRAGYAVTQDDVDAGEIANTATAQAQAPSDAVASEASTVTVPFVGESGLVLHKEGVAVDVDEDGVITAGDEIDWTFVATNSGVTTLTGLAVDDPSAGEIACEADVLLPGASIGCEAAPYRITAEDAAAGRVVNTATATALGVGVVVTSAEATAQVDVDPQPPLAITGGRASIALLVLAMLALIAGAVALRIAGTRRRAAD